MKYVPVPKNLSSQEIEEVKKIYFAWRETEGTGEIFKKYLGNYFDISTDSKNRLTTKDWLTYLSLIREWDKEQDIKELEEMADNVTEEGAEEMLIKSRRDSIVLFSNIIQKWKTNPRKIKSATLKELINLYQVIRSTEEQSKRTRLAELKEKREVVKMFLPYMRLTLPQLEAARVKMNESFERIIKLKSPGGSAGDGGGGISSGAAQ